MDDTVDPADRGWQSGSMGATEHPRWCWRDNCTAANPGGEHMTSRRMIDLGGPGRLELFVAVPARFFARPTLTIEHWSGRPHLDRDRRSGGREPYQVVTTTVSQARILHRHLGVLLRQIRDSW